MSSAPMRWEVRTRWWGYTLGALLILYGLPLMAAPDSALSLLGGCHLVLGLVIAAAVGANYRHAPALAVFLAVLMALRLGISAVFLPWSLSTAGDILLFVVAAVLAADLTRQSRA